MWLNGGAPRKHTYNAIFFKEQERTGVGTLSFCPTSFLSPRTMPIIAFILRWVPDTN